MISFVMVDGCHETLMKVMGWSYTRHGNDI